MPSFSSKKSASAYIKKIIAESGTGVVNEIAKKEKKVIDNVIYKSYTPEVYDRTYRLKNSIEGKVTKANSKEVVLESGHNPSKNAHTSVLDTIIDEAQFPGIILSGAFDLWKTGGIWTRPRDYIGKSKQVIKQEDLIRKKLKEELKKRGVDSRY